MNMLDIEPGPELINSQGKFYYCLIVKNVMKLFNSFVFKNVL